MQDRAALIPAKLPRQALNLTRADVGLQNGGQDAYYLFRYYSLLSREIMRRTPREQILRLLAVEPAGLRAPDLMRLIRPRVSQPTLWRILDGLRSEGRITVEGRGRATRYHAESRTDAAGLRSLRLHQFAARRLAGDPELRGLVRERLNKLRAVNPHGHVYHDRWEALLDGPLPTLLRTISETSEQAETLRKESPLTILVTPDERRRAFESVRTA